MYVYLFRPKTTPGMPTILFGHENSIFDSRIFLCTPAETNKSKNLWQKNSTRPNPSTWNQKSCRTKWFGNPRIHIAEEDKKVDDEDARKLNTTKQKTKRSTNQMVKMFQFGNGTTPAFNKIYVGFDVVRKIEYKCTHFQPTQLLHTYMGMFYKYLFLDAK